MTPCTAQAPEPWHIHFFQRAPADDPSSSTPALDYLSTAPMTVVAEFHAILEAVAAAPPPSFSGGGKWEAMHGDMGGYFEGRSQGAKREQFRLFCIVENADADELRRRGLARPAIAVITGMRKPWMTAFSAQDYDHVRALGNDYLGTVPRRVAV